MIIGAVLMLARGGDMVEGERIFVQGVPMKRMASPDELADDVAGEFRDLEAVAVDRSLHLIGVGL